LLKFKQKKTMPLVAKLPAWLNQLTGGMSGFDIQKRGYTGLYLHSALQKYAKKPAVKPPSITAKKWLFLIS
jgi:hypothetical protein